MIIPSDADYRDYRITVIVDRVLPPGLACNVSAHLAMALSRPAGEQVFGRPVLTDADGGQHHGFARFAVIVKSAAPDEIDKVILEGRADAGVVTVACPSSLLTTGSDDELAAAVASTPQACMRYCGVALLGERITIDAMTRHLPLWR